MGKGKGAQNDDVQRNITLPKGGAPFRNETVKISHRKVGGLKGVPFRYDMVGLFPLYFH